MHRFYQRDAAAQLAAGAATVVLGVAESHHASRVLRMDVGDKAEVMDGMGGVWSCVAESVSKHHVSMKVSGVAPRRERVGWLEVFVGIPKGSGMEDVVEKLTELGVARIVPLLTERTAVRLTPDMAMAKKEKWEATAVAAMKQCGNPWLPVVECPCELGALLGGEAAGQGGMSLVMSLEPGCAEMGEWFRGVGKAVGKGWAGGNEKMRIWVGPEGDFSPAELVRLREAGCHPLSLGPWVLRVGTAAVVAAALLLHELRLSER